MKNTAWTESLASTQNSNTLTNSNGQRVDSPDIQNKKCMKLKETHPSALATPYERACATLARIARADTIFGGARALVLARRMERRKGTQVPANDIRSEERRVGKGGRYRW